MFIELKNHKAHVFNHNEFDDSKESIILIPGAGMDHRMGNLFNFLDLLFTPDIVMPLFLSKNLIILIISTCFDE